MGDCNQAKQQQQPRMTPGDVIPGGGRVNGLFASMPGPPLIPGTGPTSITPGGAAQIVPGAGYPPSNGMFPGSSPQIIPGQSQNIIPGQNQNLFPGQSQNIIPGQNQNIIPGQNGNIIPGSNGNIIPGQNGNIIPVIPDPKCDPFIEDGVWVIPDCNQAKQQQGPVINPGDVIPGGGRTNGLSASISSRLSIPGVDISAIPKQPIYNPMGIAPSGMAYNPYGQLCPLSSKAKCSTSGQKLTDMFSGSLSCINPYDCCLCGSIQCGIGFGAKPCLEFNAGDSGAISVKSINIKGDTDLGGARINCNGIESCSNTVITGSTINQLQCVGELGCKGAQIRITDVVDYFDVHCAAMGSCDGASIEVIVGNEGDKCDGGMATIKTVEMGQIECGDNISCRDSDITIRNVGCDKVKIDMLACLRSDSCKNAKINIIGDVAVDYINCAVPGACTGCTVNGVPCDEISRFG